MEKLYSIQAYFLTLKLITTCQKKSKLVTVPLTVSRFFNARSISENEGLSGIHTLNGVLCMKTLSYIRMNLQGIKLSFKFNFKLFYFNYNYSRGSEFIRRSCPCRTVAYRGVFREGPLRSTAQRTVLF